jgi:AraC family transcriptional regulator, positive regulator of tynA and feaB
VLRRRLERYAQLLADGSWCNRTITEIAFQAGFSNVTYFGQAFKARYGMTPRDYRARSR